MHCAALSANGFIDRTNLVWKLMIVMAASIGQHRFNSLGKMIRRVSLPSLVQTRRTT
jgi:DNA-binding HxlR family transcriptional regulator